MEDRLELLKRKCAEAAEDSLAEAFQKLSPKEQLAVRACMNASKVKTPRGVRYCRQ